MTKLNQKIQVLIIEDNPADARLIETMLSESMNPKFESEWIQTLTMGLKRLKTLSPIVVDDDSHENPAQIDAILLDLGLPESNGLETLTRVLREIRHIPVIVLTGNDDDDLSTLLVQEGAQDFLVKGNLNRIVLVRSIRYAIERQKLQKALAIERAKRQRDAELKNLERLSQGGQQRVTARLYGTLPLKESLPDMFEDLVLTYTQMIEYSIENLFHKTSNNTTENLHELADELGQLKAGPRDVVAIHIEALKRKMGNTNPAKAKVYVEEGRILAFELMGYLALYYRNRAVK
jgi:DNA-binding response OmpR family regulator